MFLIRLIHIKSFKPDNLNSKIDTNIENKREGKSTQLKIKMKLSK